MEQREFHVLGQVTPRKDGVARVTGREKYTVDISLPRMLHGRILSSPYAHARIQHIDVSRAEAMGAVCITFDDVPKVRYNERIITTPPVLHKDHYVLTDKVRRMGEAVAAVAAETEELAEKAVRAIQVEYEVLPALIDPVQAMQPGVEPIYDTVLWGEEEIEIENNVACERQVEEGDVDRAFAEADVVIEGTFKTQKVYHAQMETKSVVCRPEPDGGLTVWPTTQSIHNVRILLGQIFHIPLSKINVKRVPIGGTFGSSIQMNPPIPICAALALKARRPVKLTLTREEDAHDHTRYGTQIHLRLAARIFKGKQVSPEVRCIIIPGTQQIYLDALHEGLIETFIKAGAAVSTPTCGPCLGGYMGVLATGERCVSTTNRNFVGRMGSPQSEVYLANPAVAAASAIVGRIASPEEIAG